MSRDERAFGMSKAIEMALAVEAESLESMGQKSSLVMDWIDLNDSARLCRVVAIGLVGVIRGAAVAIGALVAGKDRSLPNWDSSRRRGRPRFLCATS